jgi:hypothetical protein
MPSVRSVAEQNLVNANTVVKAYAELVRGVLESHHAGNFLIISLSLGNSKGKVRTPGHQDTPPSCTTNRGCNSAGMVSPSGSPQCLPFRRLLDEGARRHIQHAA